MNKKKTQPIEFTNVFTGFERIDELTGGMFLGQLWSIGGRTCLGKTSFALSLLINLMKKGAKVAYIGLESPHEYFYLRLMSMLSDVKPLKIAKAMLTADEYSKVTGATLDIELNNVVVKDAFESNTIEKIEALIDKRIEEDNTEIFFIDTVQHIEFSEENYTAGISKVVRALQRIAVSRNVVIVITSQLNSELEHRMDRRPMLNDFPWTSAFQDMSDVVLFVYRDFVYNPDTEDPELVEILIEKNRMGLLGRDFATMNIETSKMTYLPEEQID